jgi:hypothetical protein
MDKETFRALKTIMAAIGAVEDDEVFLSHPHDGDPAMFDAYERVSRWMSQNRKSLDDPRDKSSVQGREKYDRNIFFENPAAVALGRLGGSKSSPRKAEAARLNGRKGGRPKVVRHR